MNHRTSPTTELINSMISNGITPPQIILDNEIHRFKPDAQSRKRSGWYSGIEIGLKSGPVVYCSYGDWRFGKTYKFCSSVGKAECESKEIREAIEKAERESKEAEARRNTTAAARAATILFRSTTCESHPYLISKSIKWPTNLTVYKENLVAPMYSIEGKITGLQFISPNNDKIFLPGSRLKNSFLILGCPLGLENTKTVYIAEGIATALTIQHATREPVICAFNASNLYNVCNSIRNLYPFLTIILCADNDAYTAGNPGVREANKAATAFNCMICSPTFSDPRPGRTDFNDLLSAEGIASVIKQLSERGFVSRDDNPLPPAAKLAEEFLYKSGYIVKNRNTLVCWKENFFHYKEGHYQKVFSEDLFASVIIFLQRHEKAIFKSNTSFANDIITNLKGKGHLPTATSLPSWTNDQNRSTSDVICLENGLLSVNKWTANVENCLEPHSSSFFNTSLIPTRFDPHAACPIWHSFLSRVQPEFGAQKLIQQWFGYNLVYDVSFHKFVILYGEGANGKSVICTVLRTLLGSKNVSTVPLESFDPRVKFHLETTVGKLANIVTELNVISKVSEGELKKFVAGDTMLAERKYGHPFEFSPTARLTYATNIRPRFSDSSDGIWRRVMLIPFNVQISNPLEQNRDLSKPEWWQKSGELPGILNWALEGLKSLLTEGSFFESESILQAKNEYRSESNPTKEFLLDTFYVEPGCLIPSCDVYSAYTAHMSLFGHKTMPNNHFAEELRRVFPGVLLTPNPIACQSDGLFAHKGRKRHWIGLKQKV